MATTTIVTSGNLPDKDPRCPHCKRPVLEGGKAGVEGIYHLACTMPPMDFPATPVTPVPWVVPYQPYPYPYPWNFTITYGPTNC